MCNKGSVNGGLHRSAGMVAGPTAASTPAKAQPKTSRIPVRQYSSQQEIHHKVTQPFADISRSVHSVSVGNSSPQVLSSVGGAGSEHYSTSLYHPAGVTMTQKQQQQHPNVMINQHHHPTGIMMTQHHPTGVTVTQQNHSDEVMATQQHNPTGAVFTHQHHPSGVIMTQANGVGHVNSTRLSHDAIPVGNSFDFSSGNKVCTHAHIFNMMTMWHCILWCHTDIITCIMQHIVTLLQTCTITHMVTLLHT